MYYTKTREEKENWRICLKEILKIGRKLFKFYNKPNKEERDKKNPFLILLFHRGKNFVIFTLLKQTTLRRKHTIKSACVFLINKSKNKSILYVLT